MNLHRVELDEDCLAQPSSQNNLLWEPSRQHTQASICEALGPNRTASAPIFPEALPALRTLRAPHEPAVVASGEIIDDFQISKLLGRGASGAVYLARQQSLDRQVALKITRYFGSEARAMAMLEHPHIVQVFSETVDQAADRRLLCMQYVPGATLAELVARLRDVPRSQLSGRSLLNAIDELSDGVPTFDADGLRDRERLAAASFVEAVCRIMARLAEALHFAHQLGVLHRDIKPANILIDSYGRPFLADFGLSFAARSQSQAGDEVFGGTLTYMAPEHLDAFNPESTTTSEAVDQRSDIYALGVVLYELLALKLPRWTTTAKQIDGQALTAMEHARRSLPPALHLEFPEIPYALNYTTSRCLAGDPRLRFSDAGELANALNGCRALERARQKLPPAGPLTRTFARAPLAAAIALSFLPHLLGNLFTPAYNGLFLFARFSQTQQIGLAYVSALYGGITFPTIIAVVVMVYRPVVRVWGRLETDNHTDEIDRARRRLLTVPMAAVGLSTLAWLPLLLYMPLSVQLVGNGVSFSELAHLVVTVLLAFLIATTYSFFALQYVILRVFYPQAWADATRFAALSRLELAAAPMQLRGFQIAAGLVPLVGAILLLSLSPEWLESGSYLAIRWLTICLIVLGIFGIPTSIHVGGLITKSIEALREAELAAEGQ